MIPIETAATTGREAAIAGAELAERLFDSARTASGMRATFGQVESIMPGIRSGLSKLGIDISNKTQLNVGIAHLLPEADTSSVTLTNQFGEYIPIESPLLRALPAHLSADHVGKVQIIRVLTPTEVNLTNHNSAGIFHDFNSQIGIEKNEAQRHITYSVFDSLRRQDAFGPNPFDQIRFNYDPAQPSFDFYTRRNLPPAVHHDILSGHTSILNEDYLLRAGIDAKRMLQGL